ncbi:MAG: PAS domain-containing sensor histidine kinase, partial [Sphingomonadales bacterium]|nr:PAS domain-containing sensor histidine kinase [Sphingomonadales bacterium]
YSFATQRICWANAAAARFWQAESPAELPDRSLGRQSPSTAIRLADYRETFRRGGTRSENWTFYPRGRPTSALCHCRGVSFAGHAEAMLVEIHALPSSELPPGELRAIEALRHIPMMITLFSLGGEVLMRNPRAQEAFADFDRTQPETADHLKAMFADPLEAEALLRDASRSGVALGTATMALPGWPVHSVKLSLVTDPVTGAPASLVAQQDISELVEVSRRLAASEEALEAVLMLDVAPAVVLDVEGSRVLRANRAAEKLFGSKGEPGQDFAAAAVDPARFDRLRGRMLTQGAASGVLALRTARGETSWCSISGARIRYARADAVVLLIAEVDELHQTNAELEAALDLERRTTMMQRRFMAVSSHEFRAPLAVIDSAAQQIERKADGMSAERLAGRAARIRDAVRRLLRLYDETLDRSQLDLGAMGYAPVPGQLSDVIAGVVERFAGGEPAPQFVLDLPQLPRMALDAGLMDSAIANLVGNAIKYSDGPARVEIAAAAGIDEIVVTIRDHGIGIPAAEREAVFGERVRASNVGDRPGTGIGLSLVRQIVELHGGRITLVDLDPGAGTAFRLTFPRL